MHEPADLLAADDEAAAPFDAPCWSTAASRWSSSGCWPIRRPWPPWNTPVAAGQSWSAGPRPIVRYITLDSELARARIASQFRTPVRPAACAPQGRASRTGPLRDSDARSGRCRPPVRRSDGRRGQKLEGRGRHGVGPRCSAGQSSFGTMSVRPPAKEFCGSASCTSAILRRRCRLPSQQQGGFWLLKIGYDASFRHSQSRPVVDARNDSLCRCRRAEDLRVPWPGRSLDHGLDQPGTDDRHGPHLSDHRAGMAALAVDSLAVPADARCSAKAVRRCNESKPGRASRRQYLASYTCREAPSLCFRPHRKPQSQDKS